MEVWGWPVVFRGSAAVAAGLTTWGRLRGPRFVRLFPDVYAAAGAPLDFALHSRAAALLAMPAGAAAGWSAAELHGAGCAPLHAPAEVLVVRSGRLRPRPDLLVHRDTVGAAELTELDGLAVTTPRRTAWDLARRLDLTDAVVAVDRIANVARIDPALMLHVAAAYPQARGNSSVAEVAAHADARSGSPAESRLRMLLVLAGLPPPQAQWAVQDPVSRTAVWLDLAYPEHLVGIEYEGAHHTERAAVLRDAGRYTRLVDAGWRIYRYTALDMRDPARIVAEIRRAIAGERTAIAVPRLRNSDDGPFSR